MPKRTINDVEGRGKEQRRSIHRKNSIDDEDDDGAPEEIGLRPGSRRIESAGGSLARTGLPPPQGAAGKRNHTDVDDDDDDDEEEEEEERGDGEEDEEESSSGAEEDADAIDAQIADIPFEVLEQLRRDGSGPVGQAARAAAVKDKDRSFHRLNRHRPSEASSKRPVPRFKQVMEAPKRESIDPRFEDPRAAGSSGPGTGPSGVEDLFRRRYSFLYDEVMPGERKELREKMAKEKNPRFKAKIQAELSTVEGAIRSEEQRRKRTKIVTEIKSKEHVAVASGKKPFFLKKSEKKRLELLAKYKELKDKGGLEKFMEKRRRKNASKDHRYIPSQRRPDAGDA